jgi:hypothetical protein
MDADPLLFTLEDKQMSLASEQARAQAEMRKSGTPFVDQFNALTQAQRMQFVQSIGAALNTPVGQEGAHPENAAQLEMLQYMTRQPPVLRGIALLGIHMNAVVHVQKESGKVAEVPVADFDPEIHTLAKKQPSSARPHLAKLKKKIKEYEEAHASDEQDEESDEDEFLDEDGEEQNDEDTRDEVTSEQADPEPKKAKRKRKFTKLRSRNK